MRRNDVPLELPCAFGKYRLEQRLGAGGMAEVYRARLSGAAGFEKTVVIKRLRPHLRSNEAFVQMFVEEAKLAAMAHHENIVDVHELGQTDEGEFFIEMAYVDGVDLKHVLRKARERSRRLPVDVAVHIIAKTLEALEFLHDLVDAEGRARRVVHCDVTPENIFIARSGEIKLGDFGVAFDASRTDDPIPHTIKGKIPYMAPAQLSGARPTAASDVFAAGVVLWECLTHRRLFHAPTRAESIAKICHGERIPPSRFATGIPPALDACVLAALEIDVDKRISTAREFRERLLSIAAELGPSVDRRTVSRRVAEVLAAEARALHTSYSIIRVDNETSEPSPSAPVARRANAVAETHDIIRRYLGEAAFEIPMPGEPARVETSDIQRSRATGTDSPGPSTFDATLETTTTTHNRIEPAHPVWIRRAGAADAGPFSPTEAFRRLRSHSATARDDAISISADRVRWMPWSRFASLLANGRVVATDENLPRSKIAGSLETVAVTALLGRLALARATGQLVLVRQTPQSSERIEITLSSGELAKAASNTSHLDLPELLTKHGVVTVEQLDACLRSVISRSETLAEVASDELWIDISPIAQHVARDALESVVRWRSGRFAFVPGAAPPNTGSDATCSLLRLLPSLVERTATQKELQGVSRGRNTPKKRQ